MSERTPELDESTGDSVSEENASCGGIMHLFEAECYGVTAGNISMSRATGKRMSLFPDGKDMVLTIYNGDEWQNIRLDALQIDGLCKWLTSTCEQNVAIREHLELVGLAS